MHDASSNFLSYKFKKCARGIAIQFHRVPYEAQNAVGVVERYHEPWRCVYFIIKEGLKKTKDISLQIAVKTMKDSTGPDGIISTLLIFRAYPRILDVDPPTPAVKWHALPIKKYMDRACKLRVEHLVKIAPNRKKGWNFDKIYTLSIGSQVPVWHEKYYWDRPYTLLAASNETCNVGIQ